MGVTGSLTVLGHTYACPADKRIELDAPRAKDIAGNRKEEAVGLISMSPFRYEDLRRDLHRWDTMSPVRGN